MRNASITHTYWTPAILVLLAIAAILAFTTVMTVSAQSDDPDWKIAPTGLNVAAGDTAGELDITWDAHPQTSKTLSDYRVTWTPDGESFRPNSETDWYAYPTTNQVTVTDLEAGETYKVRVRARYDDGRKSSWSDVVNGQAAEAPADDKDEDEGSTTPRGPEPEEEGAAPSIAPRSSHPTTLVPYAWSLRPSALGEDDEFRLIFISSQRRNATSSSISTYNSWIQSQAASGHADIRTYRSGFRAVVCTNDDDARDNTGMTGTGVPVYWLDGNKVADNYADFYDGSWSNDNDNQDSTEDGINDLDLSLTENWPWTGCTNNGTEEFADADQTISRALGEDPVRLGRPAATEDGNNPLTSSNTEPNDSNHPMYGISAVFKVDAPRRAGKPTGLRATASTTSKIDLEWTAPTDTGDGYITYYKIEKSEDGGTTWSHPKLLPSPRVTYTHTGLDQDTTWHYRVSARTGHGDGLPSSVASATTHSVPQPPTNLHASASGTERINLSWRAPSDRGSSSISGYRIEMSASGLGFYDGSWEEVVANTRSTSYSHTGLKPSTVYHYRVYAMNASGSSKSSERGWAATNDLPIGNQDHFIQFRMMRAGVNGQQESDTSKIILLNGTANTVSASASNAIVPTDFDHYPQNGSDQDKKRFLRDERMAIAVEVDQNGSIIDKIVTEITYNYPSYPVEGYVTVTYTDRGERVHDRDPGSAEDLVGYYGICGTDSENRDTYIGRSESMERFNYDSCPMLSYNGDTTIIVRAYSGGTPLQSHHHEDYNQPVEGMVAMA